MTENNQPIASLQKLLDYDAGKFTSAEIQLKISLQQWINQTGSIKLKNVLQKYLEFIQLHVERLETFFEDEEIISISLHNRVMKALIDEIDEKLLLCSDERIKDACLLAGIQEVNHFKISTYGTAAAFANTLKMDKHAIVFHEAEVNEKQIDDRLTQLAEYEINSKAKDTVTYHA